jgi:hypothetical protein
MNNETIPAFPIKETPYSETFDGMSLRDYFAAKAMQGFMGSSWNNKTFESIATKSYQLSDAMMKAREQ